MKLTSTDNYIKKGIRLFKIVHQGGLFTDPLRDFKTVYDLDEAVRLNSREGWAFEDSSDVFYNITLNLYRDLKRSNSK